MTFTQGTSKTLQVMWSENGSPIDAATVLTIRDPDDVTSTPAVSTPVLGTYETDAPFVFDIVGIYYGEWFGETATGGAPCPFEVCIVPSRVLVNS